MYKIILACALIFGIALPARAQFSPIGSPSPATLSGATFTGGAVTTPINLPVGACPTPSLNITGHTGSGFYYVDEAGEESIGFCIHGVKAGFLGFAPTTSANGQGNTVFGSQAGLVLDLSGVGAALNNTIVGGEAGNKTTTGQQNTYFGSRAGHENVTANQQTFVGQGAGYTDVANDDVMLGFHAGLDLTNGGINVCLGTQACEGHATGAVGDSTAANITAVGFQAARVVTSASQGTFVGAQAGTAITSATADTFVGYRAGVAVTTGGSNVAVGSSAFTTASTAQQNTATGANTLQATTGNQNTANGYAAGISVSSGASNTLLGWEAGFAGTAITTGSSNTLVGDSAQVNSATASNRTVIGQGAIGTTDNSVKLGNTSTTTVNVGNGHVQHYVAPTSFTAGTCTATSGTGTETRGTITGTCNNQTAIVTFTTTYATTPFCVVVPVTGAATAALATFSYAVSTTAITITQTGNIGAETWAYSCSE